MKRSELEERLIGKDGIDTGFKDEHDNKIGIDSFASFLITKNELKSNAIIQDFFKDKKENFTPTDIVKNKQFKKESFDFPENEDDDKHFLSESFKFPDNFFNSDKDFNNEYMFVGLNVAKRTGDTDYSNWGNFRDVKNPTNTFKLYTQLNNSKFKGCYITDIIKSVIDSDSGNVQRNFFIGDKKRGPKKLSFLTHPGINDKLDSQRAAKFARWQDTYYKGKLAEGDKKKLTGKQLLEKNRDIIEQSIKCFVSECLAVHPCKIVAFGETADYFLTEMSESSLFKNYVDELAKGEDRKYVKELVAHNRFEVTHYSAPNIGGEKGFLHFSDWVDKAPKELELKEKELEKSKKEN